MAVKPTVAELSIQVAKQGAMIRRLEKRLKELEHEVKKLDIEEITELTEKLNRPSV
jgi:uncharacterized coiled-coil protein SlyX